ncbi:MAG: CsbD family protein [Hyphomicrobiaceae bacterium]
MGNIKQTIGRATGDAELEAEGLAQEVKGEAQKGVAEMKKAVGR